MLRPLHVGYHAEQTYNRHCRISPGISDAFPIERNVTERLPAFVILQFRGGDGNDYVPAFNGWQEGAHTGARRTLCSTTRLDSDVGADPGSASGAGSMCLPSPSKPPETEWLLGFRINS